MAKDDKDKPRSERGQTVYGRQGSPEFTIAFPFSKVEVTRADETLQSAVIAALESIGELAQQVAALAEATTDDERRAVVDGLTELTKRVQALADETAH